VVEFTGLVCAKSRRAGQFYCFLTGVFRRLTFFWLEGVAPLLKPCPVAAGDLQETVLVVEDEPDVLDLVRYNLAKAGLRVITAADGLSGLEAARAELPDAVVLDLMLPEMGGEDVCRELKAREATASIPVIMLTAKALASERVAGLELGADDYVTKPFSPRELVLRVQAVLRRTRASGAAAILEVGALELDRGNFEIRMDGRRLDLTAIEFKLLAALMENRGRTLGRDLLLADGCQSAGGAAPEHVCDAPHAEAQGKKAD
jgi:DNA-binding response OmpR family regulator